MEALAPSSGATLWNTTLPAYASYSATAIATNKLVIMGGVALDEETGAIVWGNTTKTPAVTADGVYMAYACTTLALRPATGETIWSNNACGNGSGGLQGIAVVANLLAYAQTDWPSQLDGSIYNAATGAGSGTYLVDVPPARVAMSMPSTNP